MTNNYFKAAVFGFIEDTKRAVTVSKTYFFDERNPNSVRRAFDAAKLEVELKGGKLSVYKTPRILGPWTETSTVGQGIGTLEAEPN